MSHIGSISFKASTTIPAYRIVTMLSATADTVQFAKATTDCFIGITQDTVLDTGLAIPVACYGIAKLYFNDSCASGALVGTDTSGRGIAFTAVSTGSYCIGTLVGPKVENTGTIANVLVNPFQINLA